MNTTILICIVGGSHQPIVTAIRDLKPKYICFICTGKDPATGRPGSEIQITGKGNIIKAHPADPAPSLPNIPTQAGLSDEQFEVRLVAADDLGPAFDTVQKALLDLKQRFPMSVLIADYTGGTKTMTAALVMAAVEVEGVELRLVTGARDSLDKVHNGTECSVVAVTEGLRLRRVMAPYLAAWGRYAYGEAWRGLREMPMPKDSSLRSSLQLARDLSCVFDAWIVSTTQRPVTDCRHRPRVKEILGPSLLHLAFLTADEADARREPARLWDLWLNAERRASQERYDDAVARVYRLLEWTAQWLLRARAGLDTGDLAPEKVPEGLKAIASQDGKTQAGLLAAWQLVANHLNTEAANFARTENRRLLNHIRLRNDSILAHGYTPVGRSMWERLHEWLKATFLPALLQPRPSMPACE